MFGKKYFNQKFFQSVINTTDIYLSIYLSIYTYI